MSTSTNHYSLFNPTYTHTELVVNNEEWMMEVNNEEWMMEEPTVQGNIPDQAPPDPSVNNNYIQCN